MTAVKQNEKRILEYLDKSSAYILKLPTDVDLNNLKKDLQKEISNVTFSQVQIRTMIDDSKKETIAVFEKERLNLENMKTDRSKSTFKSLRTALASKGNEPDED